MKKTISLTLAGVFVGESFGLPMGVVGYGGGWGGAYVFGPIGGLIGFLIAKAYCR